MQISASNWKSGYPLYYDTVDIVQARQLQMIMTSVVWSPIVWKGGKRNTDNFLFSDAIGLDFDEGPTLCGVTHFLKTNKIKAVIGTTKSHQKEKSGKPPCDRFRVVIPWSSRIDDFETYRQNLERLSLVLPGDPSCKDGARIFQPCIKIVELLPGNGYEWTPYKKPPYKNTAVNDFYKKNGVIPKWVREMIDQPPGSGMRNKHCFRIAAILSKYGFSERDCIGAVLACAVDLPEREKMSAAKSGFKAGKK